MDQICLHWKLANVLMPQKSCVEARKTLNQLKCINHSHTHKTHQRPSQTLKRLRHVAPEARSLFRFPYIATYHSRPFILSKLFRQVDKHEKNMTYPGLLKRDFLPNMIHCALISHCIFIKCFMPALKRTLSVPWLWLISLTVIRWIPFQPVTEKPASWKFWVMPEEVSVSPEADHKDFQP